MDYLKKLISERVDLLNKQIMFKDVTVQTEEENKEEIKQLTESLNNYDLLHNVSCCPKEELKKEYDRGFGDGCEHARPAY